MIRKLDVLDAKAVEAVHGAVLAAMGEGEAAVIAAARIADALAPAFGALAIRRRIESDMMGAYKEGFMAGRIAGRHARWHTLIWRASQTFKRLRAPLIDVNEGRFDKYNY